MPKNETGEFELVLGNRQLLSGFAIVAILFGVFFAMGYIVGRNSTPSARVAAQDTQTASTQPDTFRAQSPATPAPPTAAPATAPDTGAAGSPANPAATDTAPAASAPPVAAPEAARPVEKPADTAAAQPTEPQPGQIYLQVMAVKKQDAEVIIKTLQDKGFPALMAPSSKEGIFRVLVGPYKDAASLGKAKSDLENSGFHPFVQR